jgi:DNA mismatch repair protein MutL
VLLAVRDAVGERRWIVPDAPEPASFVREPAAHAEASFGNTSPSRAHSQLAAPAGASATSDWIFAQSEPSATETRLRFADLRLLGQFLATYLLLESKDRLLLIDQHAAHERVLYERFRTEWIERGVESQGLLAVEVVHLAPRSLAALLTARESLERLGFEIDAFGEGTVAVRAVPALLADRDPAGLVRNLADELEATGADALRMESRALDAADRIFASLACHGARRKGDVLDPREQQALLDALDAIPWAPTCPHGRPVAVPFEVAEIERRFGRR